MQNVIEVAILGVYFPLVILGLRGVWLFWNNMLQPAVAEKLPLRPYWIGMGACLLVLGVSVENIWYGTARIFEIEPMMTNALYVAWSMKLVLLSGIVMILAAIHSEWESALRVVLAKAVVVWAIGVAFVGIVRGIGAHHVG